MSLTILIADPHSPIRQSLRTLLESQPSFTVVGEAADGPGALSQARQTRPQLVIIDVEMLDFQGLESARQILAELPGVKVMALAMFADKRFARQALDAGVVGYLLKDCAHEELLAAVQQVQAGHLYLSPGIDLGPSPPEEGSPPGPQKPKSFGSPLAPQKEESMPYSKKVKDLMIPLEDYPHIPYWFTLRQAMAIVREAAIKFEGSFEPRAVLVFDEKYQLMGMLTLRDIIRGLEPKFAKDAGLIKADPNLAVLMGDMFGPGMKEQSQKPVSEVMSPIKITVNGDAPITKALFLMISENVGMMPVITDKKVAGMVRMSDLFQEISQVVLGD